MKPLDDYAGALDSQGFTVARRYPWLLVGTPSQSAAWKLHVSASPDNVDFLLAALLPCLRTLGVPFKVLESRRLLVGQCSGEMGVTQIGKFVTVYPPSDASLRASALRIADVTQGFECPFVVTDYYIGGAVFARYGLVGGGGHLRRNPLGQWTMNFVEPGVEYEVPPTNRLQCPIGDLIKAAWRPRQRLLNGEYEIVSTLKDVPGGGVFLARRRGSHYIIKEGRPFVDGGPQGADRRSRLFNEQLALTAIGGRVAPRLVDGFAQDGSEFLVQERAPGRCLLEYMPWQPWGELSGERKKFLRNVSDQLGTVVASIHAHGWVHRDLSPTNIMVSDDALRVIDFELAAPIGAGATLAGTPGYSHPAQWWSSEARVEHDIYALASLRFAMASGVNPALLSPHDSALPRPLWNGTELSEAARVGLIQSRQGSGIAAHANPFAGAKGLLTNNASVASELNWSATVRAVLLDSPRDVSGFWDSRRFEGEAPFVSPSGTTYHRSAHRGLAGPLLMVSRLEQSLWAELSCMPLVEGIVDELMAQGASPDSQMVGLHFGEMGVAVATASAIAAGMLDGGAWFERYIETVATAHTEWLDLTHGLAGQLLGLAMLDDLTEWGAVARYAPALADRLISSQQSDGSWIAVSGVPGLSGRALTGCAHGAAGISLALGEAAVRLGCPRAMDAACRGLRWVLAHSKIAQDGVREFADALDDPRPSYRWCGGGVGISLALLRVGRYGGVDSFLEAADEGLLCASRRPLWTNLSQCCGVSGVVEVLLEHGLIRGSHDSLELAAKLVEKLVPFACVAEHSSLPWSVGDRSTADLMVGLGGLLHAIGRQSGKLEWDAPPLMPRLYRN